MDANKNLYRLFTLTLLLLGSSNSVYLYGQISTVDGFNYYDINRSAFTVNADCYNLDQEAEYEVEYWFTMLELVKEIKIMFLNTEPNPPEKILGNYKIVKQDFTNQKLGNEHFSWVLIRPNDDKVRPVISIIHGGSSGDAGHSTVISLGVLDLVQRGYAVVFYQSASSQNGDKLQLFQDAGALLECQSSGSADEEIVCLQQAAYIRSQISLAALQFTKSQSDTYNFNRNLQYAIGFSGGGISTLYSSLMEEGDFDNDIITSLGNQTKYSLFPEADVSLKAVASLSGGLIGEGSDDYAFGNMIFENMNTDTRFLLLHGQDDNAVLPERGPLGWSNHKAALKGSEIICALDLDELFKSNNITSKAVINCSGDHNLMTFPCDAKEDHFGNNPDFSSLSPCTKWILPENYTGFNFSNLCDNSNTRSAWPEVSYMLMQVHDFSKLIAYYFHQDFEDDGPTRVEDTFVDEIFSTYNPSSVIPTDNPKIIEGTFSNGHWVLSDKCLSQSCEALYFNEEGSGNNPLYFGDYLTMKTNNFSGFNSDFTIEMEFKAIDNKQHAVLVSYLKTLNQGFEVFINSNGVLQFNKTINGPASLVGVTNVQDGECHSFGLVRKGNLFQLYVDGNLEKENTYNINLSNTPELRIGNTSLELASGKNGFNGVIRKFRIWDKSLEKDELLQNNLISTTENLEADFTFSEFSNSSYTSSNNLYTLQFGIKEEDVDYDPKWFNDDDFCFCQSDTIVSSGFVHKVNIKQFFKLFPNPSRENVTINLLENLSNPVSAEVYDMNGNLITKITDIHNGQDIGFDSAGIYLIKVWSDNHFQVQKIIITP